MAALGSLAARDGGMADAADLKSADRKVVGVRIPLPGHGLRGLGRVADNLIGLANNFKYTSSTPYVYDRCMKVRTNIEIEDDYVQRIMNRYQLRTKTEAVNFALRWLAGQPMTLEEARAMEGAHAIGELPEDTLPPHAA